MRWRLPSRGFEHGRSRSRGRRREAGLRQPLEHQRRAEPGLAVGDESQHQLNRDRHRPSMTATHVIRIRISMIVMPRRAARRCARSSFCESWAVLPGSIHEVEPHRGLPLARAALPAQPDHPLGRSAPPRSWSPPLTSTASSESRSDCRARPRASSAVPVGRDLVERVGRDALHQVGHLEHGPLPSAAARRSWATVPSTLTVRPITITSTTVAMPPRPAASRGGRRSLADEPSWRMRHSPGDQSPIELRSKSCSC